MPVTLDNLAQELMCWFAKETDKSVRVWNDEGELINEFATHLNENSKFNALKNQVVCEMVDSTHLVLFRKEEKANEGVIAKFMIDGNKNHNELHEVVTNTAIQLHESNLKDDFKSTTKCIVSIYNDLNNRCKFHEIEFIEIYQQYGMGCAMKRLK